MIRYVTVFLLNGCTSATAVIAQEANSVRSRAASALRHLDAASSDLVAIEQSAATVHESVAYVSDDTPLLDVLPWLSAAVIAVAVFGVVYYFRGRK